MDEIAALLERIGHAETEREIQTAAEAVTRRYPPLSEEVRAELVGLIRERRKQLETTKQR